MTGPLRKVLRHKRVLALGLATALLGTAGLSYALFSSGTVDSVTTSGNTITSGSNNASVAIVQTALVTNLPQGTATPVFFTLANNGPTSTLNSVTLSVTGLATGCTAASFTFSPGALVTSGTNQGAVTPQAMPGNFLGTAVLTDQVQTGTTGAVPWTVTLSNSAPQACAGTDFSITISTT